MGLIDSLAKPLTVKRHTAGAYVNGRWDEAAPEEIAMKGAVQPAKPNELMNLPEGQRTRASIKIYSDAELLTVDESAARKADVITYNGRDYEVKETGLYEGFGLKAYKSIALAVELAPEE